MDARLASVLKSVFGKLTYLFFDREALACSTVKFVIIDQSLVLMSK